jgi:uncharacterized protein
LPESGVRLTPAYTALLDGFSATRPSDAGFPRARWCENARLPHERLVCHDPELAAADLALAPLWQSYRRTVKPVEQARVRSDYFRRLKACGARKACIAKEQSAQERFYRRGLRSE